MNRERVRGNLYARERRRRMARCARVAIAAVLVIVAGWTECRGQSASENEIKAAFVYNFARFVDWPPESFADAGSPLVVGVVGGDPIGAVLDKALTGKSANGRALTVRRVAIGAEMKACHIVFVCASETGKMQQISEALRGASTVTVADWDRFIERGGMIQLTRENNRVGLLINVGLAERSRLKVSSKLLSLARVVRT
jgi:hypothetical protein